MNIERIKSIFKPKEVFIEVPVDNTIKYIIKRIDKDLESSCGAAGTTNQTNCVVFALNKLFLTTFEFVGEDRSRGALIIKIGDSEDEFHRELFENVLRYYLPLGVSIVMIH